MAVDKVTAAQYATKIANAITARNRSYDVYVGPIPNLITGPVGTVLEDVNTSIRKLDSLLRLTENGTWTRSELEEFVANEGIIPDDGAAATSVQVFSAAQVKNDLTIPAGFPIASITDDDTNTTLVFVTDTAATLPVASKASYFNNVTQRYELSVSATCTTYGVIGRVAPDRITRPLRAMTGFDSVTNVDAATGGRDPTTDAELIEQYVIAIMGTSEALDSGTRRVARNTFPAIFDSALVRGDDPLLVRAPEDAGAVDLWILASQSTVRTDAQTFVGRLQPIYLLRQPVISVTSVASGATTFVQGTDYELVHDTGGYSDSIKAKDYIRFLATGSIPSITGASIDIVYVQNSMPETLQSTYASPAYDVQGRDILVRAANKIDLTLNAILTPRTGYSASDLQTLAQTTLYDYINGMYLAARIPGITDGGAVELSDLNAKVRSIPGIENFKITVLDIKGGTGVADVPVGKNQYPKIALADITITIG